MEAINLNKFGYKEVTIQGEEFLIYWHRDSLTPITYEGTTSYSYEEDGETKTKKFVSRDEDKETAWENLINNIEVFLKEIKS